MIWELFDFLRTDAARQITPGPDRSAADKVQCGREPQKGHGELRMFRLRSFGARQLFWSCGVLSAVAAVSWATACKPVEKSREPAMHAVDLALFDAKEKVSILHIPAVAPDDADTNFSGVAYNPAARTLVIVDNEPNAGDKADRPDQGDLYEFESDGTYRRRIDLVGFSDPEGIALIGPDPKRRDHDLYVICEERIGTLAILSIKRGERRRPGDARGKRRCD